MNYLLDTVLLIACVAFALVALVHYQRVIRSFAWNQTCVETARRSMRHYGIAIVLMLLSWPTGWYLNGGEPIGAYGILIFLVFWIVTLVSAAAMNCYASPDTTSPPAP